MARRRFISIVWALRPERAYVSPDSMICIAKKSYARLEF